MSTGKVENFGAGVLPERYQCGFAAAHGGRAGLPVERFFPLSFTG